MQAKNTTNQRAKNAFLITLQNNKISHKSAAQAMVFILFIHAQNPSANTTVQN
jgi:hypothetical protein